MHLNARCLPSQLVTIAILIAIIILPVAVFAAAPGSAVAGFGTLGQTVTSIGVDDVAYGVAVTPAGKIVVVGVTNDASPAEAGTDFAIARYHANGTLDTTFDGDGMARVDFASSGDRAAAIAIQSDGKLVIAGEMDPVGAGIRQIAVTRLLPNGGLDTSFDTDGKVTVSAGNAVGGDSLALQPDGKIVVGASSSANLRIVRLNFDGSLDNTFGAGGTTSIPTSVGAIASDVQIRPDGRILLGAWAASLFTVIRLNANGTLDTSFDTDGIVQTDFGGNGGEQGVHAVAVLPDGKILAGGYAEIGTPVVRHFAVIRYNGNGSIDTSYGVNGKASAPFPGSNSAIPYDMALLSDGSVLLSGFINNFGAATARFTANGTLDTGYGQGGFSKPVGGAGSSFWACTLYGNSVISVGDTGAFMSQDFIITENRLTPEASVGSDFDGDAISDMSVFRPSSGQWFVLNSSNATFTASSWGSSGDRPVDGDFDGDGRTDLGVFRPSNGVWYIVNSSSGSYSQLPWGLSTDKAVPGDYDKDGKADIAVWRPSTGIYYIMKSTNGGLISTQWGANGDIPPGSSPQ